MYAQEQHRQGVEATVPSLFLKTAGPARLAITGLEGYSRASLHKPLEITHNARRAADDGVADDGVDDTNGAVRPRLTWLPPGVRPCGARPVPRRDDEECWRLIVEEIDLRVGALLCQAIHRGCG